MLVCLPHKSVLGLDHIWVQNRNYVILHKSETIVVFLSKVARAFVWNNLLDTHNDYIGALWRVSDAWQEPVFKVDVRVWLSTAHVPGTDCEFYVVSGRELRLHDA